MGTFAGFGELFSQAELAEDFVEQVVGGSFADNFPDGVGGDAKIKGDQFRSEVGFDGLKGGLGGLAGALEGVLVAGVDCGVEVFLASSPFPSGGTDLVFERFQAFAGAAADADGCCVCLAVGKRFPGKSKRIIAGGEVDFVENDQLGLRRLRPIGFAEIRLGGCAGRILRSVDDAEKEIGLAGAFAASANAFPLDFVF